MYQSDKVNEILVLQETALRDYERIRFVIKAMNINGPLYTRVIHIESSRYGSRLVTTDGKRLHVAEIKTKIQTGNYVPLCMRGYIILRESKEDITFPSWKNIIPENIEYRGVINLEKTGLGKKILETERLSTAYHSFVKNTGTSVNLRFLEDLPKCQWNVYTNEKKKHLIVLRNSAEENHEYAVIAPLAA